MDWKKTVASIAPTIGSALGGPVGGMAVQALCGLFGIEATADDAEDKIAKAVASMSPEQALSLKQIEQNFTRDMRKLDVDVLALAQQDKASARELYKKPGLASKLPQIVLGLLIVLGAFCCFYAVLANLVPDNADDILVGTIIGAAISELKNLTGFYFGSSIQESEREGAK